jgi:hypothetical protein
MEVAGAAEADVMQSADVDSRRGQVEAGNKKSRPISGRDSHPTERESSLVRDSRNAGSGPKRDTD